MNKLIIYEPPRGQGRPRFTSKPFPRAYESANDKAYKKSVIKAFREQKDEGKVITLDDMKKPLEVKIWAFMAIPKSTTKAQRKLIEIGQVKPAKKPDLDNIAKILLDALQGEMFLCDDKQIIKLEVSKHYAIDNKPRVEIEINYLDGGEN